MLNHHRVLLSGPPGSGKSSLLAAMAKRGEACVPEAARRVIVEQRGLGRRLDHEDPRAFVAEVLEKAIEDYRVETQAPRVYFDRGIPDVLAYARYWDVDVKAAQQAAAHYRYASKVYWLPAWETIYCCDEDRTISFTEAQAFGALLREAYRDCGYTMVTVPRTSVEERVRMILSQGCASATRSTTRGG